MYLSYSQVELYKTCPHKYFLTRVEKWKADVTPAALLFGMSIDASLNYVLMRAKRKHSIYPDTAKKILKKYMSSWNGQNKLEYFKNESPHGEGFDELDDADKQWVVWNHLMKVGETIITTYIDEILPQLGTILSVQTKRYIDNEAGDKFILITDFRAKLTDGREVTFDNKTSSDIKKYYGLTSVKKSNQLAIYTEYEESKLAGYVALSKKLNNGKIDYKIVIDEIDEEKVQETFNEIDVNLRAIKNKEFPKNEKNCYQFGKLCEVWNLCKKGSSEGLIKKIP